MFAIQLMPKAIKDLEAMPKTDAKRMYERLLALENGLIGDIKRLTNFSPTYRLRSGDWRALFDISDTVILVHRIIHRRDAYR